MKFGAILHLLGRLCLVLAGLLLLPLLVCLHDGELDDGVAPVFLYVATGTCALGLLLLGCFRFRHQDFGHREAFFTVLSAWLLFTSLGGLPFLLTGAIPRVIDAWFETTSGAATCGASILPDPAVLDRALLFWRATLIWVGGLGIVALYVAVLPLLGAGGNILFQAEAAGPEKDKLLPRISSMSKLLWSVYAGLTVLIIGALLLAGMSPFEAVCHGFATVGTGGFGTRADSLASYGPAIQWTVTAGMLVAGMNYMLLLSALRGSWRSLLASTELRVYLALMLGVSAVCVLVRLAGEGSAEGWEPLVRGTVFSVVSLGSTTGFATVDFELWAPPLHLLLLLCMFCGACAGSTSGANKISRIVLYAKAARRELLVLLRPSAVRVVRVQGRAVPDAVVRRCLAFLVLFLAVWLVLALVLMADGLTAESAFSAVLTCLSGVGPGFGSVGPTQTFAPLSDLAKSVCIVAMLLGRLEFFSVFVLLSPHAWRR